MCPPLPAVILATLLSIGAPPRDSATIPDPAWLREKLEAIREKHHLPALAASLVVEGKIVAASAVGFRKWDSPQKVTRDDAFHLGSVAKPITATMIAKLVEKGVIRWDSTLSEMFPELVRSMNPAYRGVTVAQLLSHSSGMPYQPGTPESVTDGKGRTVQQRRYEYTKAALADPPEAPPGTKVIYGGGPVIVVSALERMTKTPYEELIRELVFKPLGMTTAGFGAQATPGKVDGTWDHELKEGRPVTVAPKLSWKSEARAPVGRNVHCSVIDLARFCSAHLEPGFLTPESFATLHSPVKPVDYGPGWALSRVGWARGAVLWHSGSMGKNHALAHVVPDEKFATCVLTNIDGDGVHEACDEVNLFLVAKLREGVAKEKIGAGMRHSLRTGIATILTGVMDGIGKQPMDKPELAEAVSRGDLETIRKLLDAGADVRYVRPSGYTAIVDVMHGRSILEDPQLLPVLRLLIERGAALDTVTDYGESALSVSSRIGRFDAVELLLDAKADPSPLGWTALHRAVALGTLADVKKRLESGDDVKATDRWERTPLLLSLQVGDIEKATLLLSSGGSLNDRGRCAKTPLMYPAEGDQPAMVEWLLDRGVKPDEKDEFGGTALIGAAEGGSAECVRLLLAGGADPNLAGSTETPIAAAANLKIARMLAAAGADFTQINGDVRDELTKRIRTDSIECTLEEYRAGRHRVFGNANPQPLNLRFWKAMVASGSSAYHARSHFKEGEDDQPGWSFERFGKSFTELPDGRVIEIGGEHEDSYDSDFCIYNDVIVHRGDGTFDIYAYPKEVFPPTDFHTATLVGDSIYIVGSLGYGGKRKHGVTQVYRLDTKSLSIKPVETHGESPGWISDHKAKLVGNALEVTGGKVCRSVDGEETYEDNRDRYLLRLDSMTWSKVP